MKNVSIYNRNDSSPVVTSLLRQLRFQNGRSHGWDFIMSKFNRVLLTLCSAGVVTLLYCFPFYISVSIILPAVFIFLYCDYKNQQPKGRVHSHAVGLGFSSYVKSRNFLYPFWLNINKNMQKYYVFNHLSGNKDISVPLPFTRNRNTTAVATSFGNHIRSSSNLDENRTRARPNSFYRPNSNYSFNVGLSPIRLDEGITARDFRNLNISDIESSRNNRTRNQSLTPLKDSPGSSGSNRKYQNGKPSPKNIQSIAGPLLASTRYNLSLDSVTYTDAMSTGLSSRVVKYANESASRNYPATHQHQYSGPGQFPTVQLSRTSRLPMVKNQPLGRSPVRIRIAPPEYCDRRNYVSPDPNSSLSLRSSLDRLQEIARTDRLQDVPRKRLHAQLGEMDDETTKKQRVSDLDCSHLTMWTDAEEDTTTSKRGREESPKEDSQTKRTKNNEISSSLSSSRNLRGGTNKRKQTQEDWSQNGALMPVGKQAKKSSPRMEDPTTSAEQIKARAPKLSVDLGSTPLTSKVNQEPLLINQHSTSLRIGSNLRSEDRISVPTKMTISPAQSLLYQPNRDVSGWVTTDSYPESEMVAREKIKLAGDDLKNQREQDAKRRLSSMMFIVGDKEKLTQNDLTPTPSFITVAKPASSMPTFSMSTPTTILSVAKPTPLLATSIQETPKSVEKHVHFADNLTQVKTFTSTSTHSFGSGDTTGEAVTSQSAITNLTNSNKSQTSGLPTSLSSSTTPLNKVQEANNVSILFPLGGPNLQDSNTASNTVETTTKFLAGSPNVTIDFGNLSGVKNNGELSFGNTDLTCLQDVTKPSSGFSFGSNLPNPPSTISGFSTPKSTQASATFSAVAPTSTTAPVFGKNTPGKVPYVYDCNFLPFGQKPMVPDTTSVMSTPTPIATPNTPILFGKTPSTPVSASGSSAFGVIATPSNTSFGSSSAVSFGGSTQSQKFPGSDLFAASKDKVTPLPSFGTPITTSASPGFGTPVTASAGISFGAPSSSHGTPSLASASGGFGTPVSSSANSAFSTPVSMSASAAFGSPAIAKPTPTNLFSFGATATTESQSSGFGAQSSSTQAGFGSQPSSTQSGFGGFGSLNQPAVFGGKPSAQLQQGGFSFGGNSGPTTLPAISNPAFGTKSDKPSSSFSVGSQNVSSNMQSASRGGAQGFKIDFSQTNKPNGGSALFGGLASQNSTNSAPSFSDATKQATDTTQNAFQFGASSAKPFSFGGSGSLENSAPNTTFGSAGSNSTAPSNTNNPPSAFGQSVFGSQVQQPNSSGTNPTPQKPASLFSFGGGSAATQQQPTSFGFGSSASTVPSGGFAFGGGPSQETQQPKPFSFGSSSSGPAAQPSAANPFGQASSAPTFQFGSASSAAPGGFNFGGPPSNMPTPAFGANPTNNAFQMAPVPQQPGQGMFSIGSGSSAPRARTARLMRRQR